MGESRDKDHENWVDVLPEKSKKKKPKKKTSKRL